ncbi:hypothetical protein JG687_00019175 [Phytophthora cactorum]|uniref:Uncharacterized protein n=1 Tax=Phytophthora cactorum TaxID=29920 RepID=A0A8T1TLX2_9STRA|nr:hypothetical protein JG687_00019175 [Phytophthora cactorum]
MAGRSALPLPAQLHCRLSVKSDEPLTPCRDRVPGHDFAFMIADGYDMLVGHVKRILERTDDLGKLISM